jgi:hypothetical protein
MGKNNVDYRNFVAKHVSAIEMASRAIVTISGAVETASMDIVTAGPAITLENEGIKLLGQLA